MTRPARPISTRAFALPMVLLLMVVSGVMLSVMLRRHAAQLMTTKRELDGYTFGHATRGLGDALDAWIKYQGRSPVAEALDPDGRAFDLVIDGGQRVAIRLRDGQGRALMNLSGLSAENVRTGREVLRRLKVATGDEVGNYLREDGPLAVSVNTASSEVLLAVLRAITGDSGGSGLVNDILSRRDSEGLIDPTGLQALVDQSELAPEHKARANALLTANPALWRVVAEAVSPNGVVSRFRAWVIITRGATVASGDRAASLQRSVSIFGWEKVEEDGIP